jgi:uncharacterized protein
MGSGYHLQMDLLQYTYHARLRRLLQRHCLLRLVLVVVAAVHLNGCAWLDVRLRQAAFRPTQATEADRQQLPADAQVYFVPARPRFDEPALPEGAVVEGQARLSFLYFPSAVAGAPTVLYLHGVFRHAIYNLPKIEAIRQAGFSVLAVDYRGWGFSSVFLPSEQSLLADAMVALDELKKRETRPHKRIVFGHSLGGAVGIALLSGPAGVDAETSLGGLVLESTFASVRRLTRQARWYGFLALPLVGNTFDSYTRIGQLKLPLWMMHGAKDDTIPLAQGQHLYGAAPKGTPFYIFENAEHSDLYSADSVRYQRIWREIGASLKP